MEWQASVTAHALSVANRSGCHGMQWRDNHLWRLALTRKRDVPLRPTLLATRRIGVAINEVVIAVTLHKREVVVQSVVRVVLVLGREQRASAREQRACSCTKSRGGITTSAMAARACRARELIISPRPSPLRFQKSPNGYIYPLCIFTLRPRIPEVRIGDISCIVANLDLIQPQRRYLFLRGVMQILQKDSLKNPRSLVIAERLVFIFLSFPMSASHTVSPTSKPQCSRIVGDRT